MLSCDDIRHELSNLIDDDISAELRRELERHLAECRVCTVLYDSTRKTLRIVTDSRSFDLPEEASRRLTDLVMAAVGRARSN